MFFSHELLSRRTALGQVWLVAYSRRRLTRRVASGVSVVSTCDAVLAPSAPMALRMSSILMSGIVLLYQRQQHFLLEDFASFIARVKAAVRRTEESRSATLHAAALTAHAAKITIDNDVLDGDHGPGGQAMVMLRMMDADDGARGVGHYQGEDTMMEMLMEMMKMPQGGGTDPLAEGADMMEDFFMVDLGDGKGGGGGAGAGVPQRERARRASRAMSIGGGDIDEFLPAVPQPGDAQEDELPAVAMMPLDEENLLTLGNDDKMMTTTTAMPMPDVNIADGMDGVAGSGDAVNGRGGGAHDADVVVKEADQTPPPPPEVGVDGGAPAKRRRVRFESNSISFEHDAVLQVSRAHYHAWQTDTSDITCNRCAVLAAGNRKKRKRATMARFAGPRDVEQMLHRPSSVLLGNENTVHRDVWAVLALPTLQSARNKRMRGGDGGVSSSPVTPFGLNADLLEMEMPVPMMPDDAMQMGVAAYMYVCFSPPSPIFSLFFLFSLLADAIQKHAHTFCEYACGRRTGT